MCSTNWGRRSRFQVLPGIPLGLDEISSDAALTSVDGTCRDAPNLPLIILKPVGKTYWLILCKHQCLQIIVHLKLVVILNIIYQSGKGRYHNTIVASICFDGLPVLHVGW